MKRVVNVKNMKYKSYNQDLESDTVGNINKTETDLHNFQPNKDISYTKTIANRKFEPSSCFSMVQPSELDLDDNFTIRKRNPLFHSDEDYYYDQGNTDSSPTNSNHVENKKIALELMFERADEITKSVSKIDVKFPVKQEKPPQQNQEQQQEQRLEKQNEHQIQQEQQQNDVENYYDPNYERILPETISQIATDTKFSVSNENEVYQSIGSEEDRHSISNFDAISLSSYTIRERKNSEISVKTQNIKKEMNDQFISLEIKPTDLLYNVIIAGLYQKNWIAGLKSSSVSLSNKIHFGDEILSINDYLITDKEGLLQLVRSTVQPYINIKIKRLPFARVIFIQNVSEAAPDEIVLGLSPEEILAKSFGIKLKHNTCKIEKIIEEGLFYRHGLKYDSNKVEYDLCLSNRTTVRKSEVKERLTKWVITEINGEYISYKCIGEEVSKNKFFPSFFKAL